jgi:hypothetical protein
MPARCRLLAMRHVRFWESAPLRKLMSRRFTPTDAFVDESMRGQRYLLGCVLVEARSLNTVRRSLVDVKIANRRVHFTNESPGRRREILQLIASLPVRSFVVLCRRTHGVRETDARSMCLQTVVAELQRDRVGRLVIESRQDDREDVTSIERVRSAEPRLVFEHRRAKEEPLLWIADAIVWAVGSGGEWRELVEPVFNGVIETDP